MNDWVKAGLAWGAGLWLAGLSSPVRAGLPAEGMRYEYRIVAVETEAEEESGPSRRLMDPVGFSSAVSRRVEDGREYLVLTRSERTQEGDRTDWELTLEPKTLGLIRSSKKTVTREGKLLEERTEYFANSTFHYPPQSYHFHELPLLVGRLNLQAEAHSPIHLTFSPEMMPWGVEFVVEGEETITVPAGTFACVKLRMEFDDEILGKKGVTAYLVKLLFPKQYVWVEKAEPHTMIRLQGKLRGFNSPEQAQELVKVVGAKGSADRN